MKKLYVLVSQDLSRRQQFVQGTHAVAQYCIDNPGCTWKNGTLVMLKASSIEEWEVLLEEKDIKYSKFIEPYYDDKLTAIAALNIGDLTGNLKLI